MRLRRRAWPGFLLNLRVQRFAANSAARANLQAYETTGLLAVPAVTMHTAEDPIVPYWHELLYRAKTILTGSGCVTPTCRSCGMVTARSRSRNCYSGSVLLRLQVEGLT